MTQEKNILDYMKMGHSVTSLEAFKMFGCLRLSARILKLRELGHEIRSEFVTMPAEDGKAHKVFSRYTLVRLAPEKQFDFKLTNL